MCCPPPSLLLTRRLSAGTQLCEHAAIANGHDVFAVRFVGTYSNEDYFCDCEIKCSTCSSTSPSCMVPAVLVQGPLLSGLPIPGPLNPVGCNMFTNDAYRYYANVFQARAPSPAASYGH